MEQRRICNGPEPAAAERRNRRAGGTRFQFPRARSVMWAIPNRVSARPDYTRCCATRRPAVSVAAANSIWNKRKSISARDARRSGGRRRLRHTARVRPVGPETGLCEKPRAADPRRRTEIRRPPADDEDAIALSPRSRASADGRRKESICSLPKGAPTSGLPRSCSTGSVGRILNSAHAPARREARELAEVCAHRGAAAICSWHCIIWM